MRQLFVAAEVIFYFIDTSLGLVLFSGILVFLLFHTALNWNKPIYEMLASLAIVPLIRLLPLSLPLMGLPPTYNRLIIYIFVLLTAMLIARTLRWPLRDIGINLNLLPIQILIGITGLMIGALQFVILELEQIATDRIGYEWSLMWGIVLLSAAFVEEVVFRGLLQHAAIGRLGRLGGSVYVASLYTILQQNHTSLPNAMLVFGVGLFYAWIVARTHSIVGATISHGLANIALFTLRLLVIPTST